VSLIADSRIIFLVRLVKKVCPWVDGAKYPYFSTVCFSLDTPLGHQEEDPRLIISACAARSGEIVLFCS